MGYLKRFKDVSLVMDSHTLMRFSGGAIHR